MASRSRSVWMVGCALAASICPTSQAIIPFEKEAVPRGVDYLVSSGLTQFGCGVAFVDLDGDGDPDLVTTGKTGGAIGLFENVGGTFIDHFATSGIPTMSMPAGVCAADYDNDGDLDLFFTNWQQGNVLMRNDGDFKFTNVTAAAGLTLVAPSTGAAWGDYDGDGWLDLYVCIHTGFDGSPIQNKLYRNNGNGTFTDVAPTLGVTDGNAPTLLCVWFDYDRDGDVDLYLGTDRGSSPNWQNRFFENLGGTFADVTATAGAEGNVDCMGFAVGDLDKNGFQDVYMSNIPLGNVLLMNNGDKTFTNSTSDAGMLAYEFGWATLFFDFDNDTWLDTFLTGDNFPKRLFRGGPTWPYDEIGFDAGFTTIEKTYCAAIADVDGDGDLDLAVSSHNRKIDLYINQEGSNRNWIRFNVVGSAPNRFAVGAMMDLRVGSDWQLAQVFSGSTNTSQTEYTLHFGLGAATRADEIVVTWPGGNVTRTLSNYDAGHVWTIYPPERMGDADNDGDIDRQDINAAIQCLTGSGPGLLTPGCEIFDMDGDGDVDAADLALMGFGVRTPLPHAPPIHWP